MTDLQEKYAKKIAGLLAKAESTTPEEAELLTDKAAQLMAQYAIEQAFVDLLRGKDVQETILEKRVVYHSSYHHALFDIGSAIAYAQGCRVLLRREKNETVLYVIGFESDVDRAIMLDASLQIQAKAALAAAVRSGDVQIDEWMTAMQKFLERREFLFGFADGVRTRLYRANRAGKQEFKAECVRDGADETETENRMALVVRSRSDRVDDWVDKRYGKLRSSRGGVNSYGSGAASSAGRQAGLNADTGSAGRVGQRKSLNR